MNSIKKYVNKRFKKLTDHLKGYRPLHDQEALHQIRVEIKKLKSIISLIHFSFPKFRGHANFVPLRRIFRRAGEIRESEVLYKLQLAYEIDGVVDESIPKSAEADQLIIAFQKDVPRFLKIVKNQKKNLANSCKKVSKDSHRAYLKRLKAELKPILFPRLRRKMLHKARKLVKEILHLEEFGGKSNKHLFFSQAEKVIGQWHDKQVLLLLLKKIKSPEKIDLLKAKSSADELELKKMITQYYGDHKK